MEEKDRELLLLDYLQGRLSAEDRQTVETLLATDAEFARQFSGLKAIWSDLDVLNAPQVSAETQAHFEATLKAFEQTRQTRIHWWNRELRISWGFALVMAGIILCVAFIFLLIASQQEKTLLYGLDNPSSIERIKAVNYVDEHAKDNRQVVEALLTILNTDPSENVRLVTLDALLKLAHRPYVRAGLVHSIARQQTELMQLAIANAMLKLQDKTSVKPLQKLMQSNQDTLIKQQLSQTVKKLESI